MKPSLALEQKRQMIRDMVNRYPTRNPRVFGSVLHGTDTEESDLYILVDALPGTSLFDLSGLQHDLEDLLGVKVDVRTPQELSPILRPQVLSEAAPL